MTPIDDDPRVSNVMERLNPDTAGGERCRAIRDELSAWLDNELSPDTLRTVETHLDECPACMRLSTELKGDWELLTLLPSPASEEARESRSKSFAASLRRRIESSRRRNIRRFAAAAAALLFALILVQQLLVEQSSPGLEPQVVSEPDLELFWEIKVHAEVLGTEGIDELLDELDPESPDDEGSTPAGPIAFEYILEEELEKL